MPAFILTAEDAKDAEKYKGLYSLTTNDYRLSTIFNRGERRGRREIQRAVLDS